MTPRRALEPALVVLAALALFASLLFSIPGLPGGDDGYRHIKTAFLLRTQGWDAVKDFPWLRPAFPPGTYADLWLLFHVFLMPFTVGNLLLGAKLAALVLATAIVALFYALLSAFGIRHRPFWVAVLLFCSCDFLIRITLTRALLLNIVFVLLTMLAVLQRRMLLLGGTTFLFSWNNVAAPLSLLVASLHALDGWLSSRRFDARPVLAAAGGLLLGWALHPQFPRNLQLAYVQTVGVLFLVPAQDLRLGNELAPFALAEFLRTNPLLFVLWVPAVVLQLGDLARRLRATPAPGAATRPPPEAWLLLLALAGLFLVLRSRRFVEYWVPLAVLSSARALDPLVEEIVRSRRFRPVWILAGVVLVGLGTLNFRTLVAYLESAPHPGLYESPCRWLEENSREGDVVFNPQWAQFPLLFFWNHHNRYLVGMDPTFLYLRDRRAYEDWNVVSEDRVAELAQEGRLRSIVRGRFGARYLFVESDLNPGLDQLLRGQEGRWPWLHRVYADGATAIYEID